MGLVADVAAQVAAALHVPVEWVLAFGSLGAGALAGFAVLLALRRAAVAARRTATDLDDLLLRLVHVPAALTLVIVGAVYGATFLVPPPWEARLRGPVLVTALLVLWGASVARLMSHTLLHVGRRDPGVSHARGAILLGRFAKVIVGAVIALSLLTVWDIEVTPLLASAGIAALALALAAQESLANMFAGIAIYLDRVYELGDYVVLDAGTEEEIRGEVRDVGLRSTRILTRDNVLVVVPNSVIANGRIVNESQSGASYRLRVAVSVAYGSDMDKVEAVLVRVATRHPIVLTDPEPRARLREFGDSGVAWELLAWIGDPRDRGLVVHELGKAIHRAFQEEGITIPFPQRVLHQAPPQAPPPQPPAG